MAFLIRNGFLIRFQLGFRSTHSTTTALLNVTDDFRKACELLLDFSKAFNRIVRDLLYHK
jgi:hypothetical protein